MTREQQKSIIEFVGRTANAGEAELDVEADAIIRALFVRNPDAAYRMTMLAMAQEQELAKHCAMDLPAEHSHVVRPPAVVRWLNGVLKRDDRRADEKVASSKLR